MTTSAGPSGVLPRCPHCDADLSLPRSIRSVVDPVADAIYDYECSSCGGTWPRGRYGPRWPDHYEAPVTVPEVAVVEAVYEHHTGGRRVVSFAVRADTVCAQVRLIAELLPPATWTVTPNTDDTSGHRSCPPHGPDILVHPDGRQTCGKCGTTL